MDDLFYLNRDNISLDALSSFVAQKAQTLCENAKEFQFPNGFQILMPFENGMRHFDWTIMEIKEFLEPEDAQFLTSNQIVFAVMITHHHCDMDWLLPIITAVLETFGGMIGNDSDRFLPIFTAENIAHFSYSAS